MKSNEEPSRRIKQFLKVLDKALEESRNAINTQVAVEECYGEDAAIFAGVSGDDTISFDKPGDKKRLREEEEKDAKNMLADLMDGMMDRVNEQIKREVQTLIRKENLNEKFAKIEKISHILQKKDKKRKVEEEDARKNTSGALNKLLKLPEGCSPMHLINFHAYRVKLEQKEALIAEIQSIEAETEAIQSQINEAKEAIYNGVQDIGNMGDAISNAADICSLRTE